MKKFTVVLEDGTVGKCDAERLIEGDTATVEIETENGIIIQKTGIVVEILEEKEL